MGKVELEREASHSCGLPVHEEYLTFISLLRGLFDKNFRPVLAPSYVKYFDRLRDFVLQQKVQDVLYDLRDFSISLLPKISMESSSVAFDLNESEEPEFRGTLLVLITYAFSVFGDDLLFK